jgi:hypothetical protein
MFFFEKEIELVGLKLKDIPPMLVFYITKTKKIKSL